MELIGKQIAIETILGQPPELHYPSWYAAQIEKLPPAPPEYLAEQAGILVTDADTISRTKAIDALDEIEAEVADGYGYQYAKWREYFAELPPAQPEIVQCKECKYWKDSDGVYRRGFDAESKCPLNLKKVYEGTFYCGMAERRTDE